MYLCCLSLLAQVVHIRNTLELFVIGPTKSGISFEQNLSLQVMQEIQSNGIRIYSGEIDEDEDNAEIRDLRVGCGIRIELAFYYLYRCDVLV